MQPAPNRSRVWTAVYWILVALLFVAAAFLRFHTLPLPPFADRDLGGYISPVLSALQGRGFILSNGRGFAYPAFVWFILRVAGGDFRAVAVVQHLLGMLTGALLLFAWIRARPFVERPRTPSWLHDVLGLALTATYLLFNWPILYEHRIRPEAIFPFFVALNIAANVVFIERRFLAGARRTPFALGAGILFSAILLYMLKPAWGFSVIFCTLPVWLSLFTTTEPVSRKLLLLTVSGVLSVGLLLLPEKSLERTDSSSGVFLPKLLFAMHANLILDQMNRDLATHADVPYDKTWLAATAASLSVEIEKSKPGRATLGFDPDYLIYEHSICDEITRHFAGQPDALAAFFKYYYERAALKEPVAMTRKTLVQMGVFYSFKNTMYRTGPIDVPEEYKKSLEILSGNLSFSPLIQNWGVQCRQALASARRISNGAWVMTAVHLLRFTHVFLSLGALVLSAYVLLNGNLRGDLLPLALLDLLVFSYSFGNNLTVAIVHTLEVNRYVQNEFSFVLFLHFLTLLLLVELCLRSASLKASNVS